MGAPAGSAHHRSFRGDSVSSTAVAQPRGIVSPRRRLVGPIAARRRAVGHAGARHQDRLARGRQRGRRLRRDVAGVEQPLARVRLRAAHDGADRRRLPVADPGARPAQVPAARDGLPDRLPDHPDHLQRRHRVHQLLDGSPLLQGRGDHGDQDADPRAAGERQDLHDGARRAGRAARADPQGRRDRPVLRRLEGRAEAAAEERRHREHRDHQRREGLRHHQGPEAAVTRPPAVRAQDPVRRRQGDPGRGPVDRRRAAADAALRQGEGPVRPHQRRHGLHRRRARLVHGGERAGARARLEDVRRRRRTSAGSSTTR